MKLVAVTICGFMFEFYFISPFIIGAGGGWKPYPPVV
jgi:hypothetical protein